MFVLSERYSFCTTSLIIRFYQNTDFQKWQKLFSDMNPKRNQWDWDKENVEALTAERFNKKLQRHQQERKEGKVYYFCVEDKAENLVGICLISSPNPSSAEIGFQLNNKYWGHGLGTEIAQGIISVCKTALGVTSIKATVNKNNTSSIKILQKIGMKPIDNNVSQLIFEMV